MDLSGHIAGNRLLVFARKPAPVQVTYIGYQNTTGMAAMDYRLTDAWSDPPGTTDPCYTEKLVRLPQAFFCYQPSPDAPPVTPLPANDRGYVTFGSFNNFAKVTPQVLAAWAEILTRTPGSRLVILADAVPSLVAYVAQSFAQQGIAADRVEVAARRPRTEYLELIESGRHRARSVSVQGPHHHLRCLVAGRAGGHAGRPDLCLAVWVQRAGDLGVERTDCRLDRGVCASGRGPGRRPRAAGGLARRSAAADGRLAPVGPRRLYAATWKPRSEHVGRLVSGRQVMRVCGRSSPDGA